MSDWFRRRRDAVSKIERDFSSKDQAAWLANFVGGEIKACQHAKDGAVKSFTVHNGSVWEALLALTIPSAIMAWKVFSELAKKQYSHSKMAVLAVTVKGDDVVTLASAKRFNASGDMFEELGVVYALCREGDDWKIKQLWAWDDPAMPPAAIEAELGLSGFDRV